MGGLVAAVLADAGEDVKLIVRPEAEKSYPRILSLDSPLGVIRAPITVASSVAVPVDALWIAVKATQLNEALHSTPRQLKLRAVVPLLNGIDHVAKLREWFGNEKIIPATIGVESERIAPGEIVHRSPFVRLNLAANGENVLATAVEEFRRFGFECNFVEDEQTLLWSKLAFLAPIALSTSAWNCPLGEVINDSARLALLEECVREACAVGSAAGATLDADRVLAGIKALPPIMRSSMQKDLANGNAPELDAISGPILRGGETHGIPAQVTTELVRAVLKRVSWPSKNLCGHR